MLKAHFAELLSREPSRSKNPIAQKIRMDMLKRLLFEFMMIPNLDLLTRAITKAFLRPGLINPSKTLSSNAKTLAFKRLIILSEMCEKKKWISGQPILIKHSTSKLLLSLAPAIFLPNIQ